MNARQAKVCPACGVLNRPSWDFCAKCNESLEGAALTTQGEDPAAEAAAPARVSGGSSALVLGATVVAVAVFAVLAWRYARDTPPPSRPDPAMFTIATLPPELPQATPPPTSPGLDAFNQGQRLLAAGDLQGAREQFAAAVAADGSNAQYRAAHGRALWAVGERAQALAELGVAARLDPARQVAYARALDIAGDRTAAVAEYEQAIAVHPDSADLHRELGQLLYRWGRYGDAAPHLEQAAMARPSDARLKQELAWALDSAGQTDRAAETYREVLEMAPGAAISRGLLADNLYKRGLKNEAMAVVREGLVLSPDAPLLHRQLGSLLEREGERAEAAAAYRRYAQLAPGAPDAQDLTRRAAALDPQGGTP